MARLGRGTSSQTSQGTDPELNDIYDASGRHSAAGRRSDSHGTSPPKGRRSSLSPVVGSLPGSLGDKKMVYVLINLSVKHAFSVTLPTAAAEASGGQRAEWHLRGAPDERATKITVNGESLALAPSLPPFLWDLGKLAEEAPPGAPVAVAPASIVFAAV